MSQEKRAVVASPKSSIFWIMQYSSPFIGVYQKFKKTLSPSYQFIDPLENKNQTSILAKIIPQIITADFVIADVSTIGYDAADDKRPLYNGNVMFELGVAMSYRKNLIMISSITRRGLPFDISGYHVNYYEEIEIDQFIKEIKSILDNPETVYSNPVSDHDKFFRLVELQSVDAPVPEARTPKNKRSTSKTSLSSLQFKKLEDAMDSFPPCAFKILWLAYKNKQNISIDPFGTVIVGDQEFNEPSNTSIAITFLKDKKYIRVATSNIFSSPTNYYTYCYLEKKGRQLCKQAEEAGLVSSLF